MTSWHHQTLPVQELGFSLPLQNFGHQMTLTSLCPFLKPNSHLVLFSKTWIPVLCLLTLLLITVQVSCLDPQ